MDDAWNEEASSVYFRFDPRKDGRPVTLTLSRRRRSEPGYTDMRAAVAKEKEWRQALEESGAEVAGRPTVRLFIKGESKTAFIETSEGYLTAAYSAPPDLFERYLPVYKRMLQSLRVR
jgi:hypothetical protein